MKSQEEDRVTVLGMCCCLSTAVPGLLVCVWACDFTRVLDVPVPRPCEAPGPVAVARPLCSPVRLPTRHCHSLTVESRMLIDRTDL